MAAHGWQLWFTELNGNRIGRITTRGASTEFSSGVSQHADLGGIAAGSDGNLWFTERSQSRVGRISPSGRVTEFSSGITPSKHRGEGPAGIAAGPDGNLWFTERDANRIGRITPSGTVTEFASGIRSYAGLGAITPGPDGNLWFTEPEWAQIGRITPVDDPPRLPPVRVRISSASARVSASGATRVKLTCGYGSGRCTGTLALTKRFRVRRNNRVRVLRITLAHTRYSITPTHSTRTALQVTRTGRRLLSQARHHHLPVLATAHRARRAITLTR